MLVDNHPTDQSSHKSLTTRQKSEHPSMFSRLYDIPRARKESVRRTLHWTQDLTGLLSELLDVLSSMTEQWRIFTSDGGDQDYFTTNPSFPLDHVHRYLNDIDVNFDSLESLERKLDQLHKAAKAWTEDVSQIPSATSQQNYLTILADTSLNLREQRNNSTKWT